MKRILPLILLLLFAFPAPVQADVAPPANPPGSNPLPGAETTQVRMLAETVLIAVRDDAASQSLGSARVTADFSMQNTGTDAESMPVRFPIAINNGFFEYPEITDMVIKVNGRQVVYRRVNYPDFRYQDESLPWAEFDVTFPAGKETAIQVSYTLKGTGYYPYTAFYYILETGAGWKDSIGSADIILRLPYPASPQNVVLDLQIGWGATTHGLTFEGNEARWHFENFEPGPDEVVQNMEFALVAPAAWRAITVEQEKVTRSPSDGEAWGRLGRAYKQIFLMSKGYRSDPGGEELYRLSVEAYERCLELKPDDAQWHAGFADLLVNRAYWDSWWQNPTPEMFRGLEEIHTALQLAPNDPIVQEIATNITYMSPDGMKQSATGFDFPWLTQTPTLIPPTPTIAPVFDPVTVSGTYQSAPLTLRNEQTARLTFTLQPDHSVVMETLLENESPVITTGSWMDMGDGTLRLAIADPLRGEIYFVFRVEPDRLLGVEYPGLYGEAGIELARPVTATPTPAATATREPSPTGTPEPAPTSTPPPAPTQAAPDSSQPGLQVCGSSALLPAAAVVWWTSRKKRSQPAN